jgi:CcmD family protein
MFEWVLLTYAVIFGAIAAYLVTLWLRVREAERELKRQE